MKRIEKKKKDKLGQDMEARKALELYGTRYLRTCRRAKNESRVRWAGR